MDLMDSATSESDPVLGRVIGGKYEIQSLLGGGGMGKVYKARHRALDKIIAIKVLHGAYQSDAKFAQRFEREALAASKLDHPNSMQVLDFGREPDGLLYIAMELLDGKDLHKILATEGLPSLERTVDIMSQTLAALQAAHGQGIVHRDMKPENIVIVPKTSDDGTIVDLVKVCDFGIAKIQDTRAYDDAPTAAPLTTAGMVCGTPEFMSPEQARGLKLDARSDIYSCGVVLYQMATGRLPFTGDSAIGIVMKHIMDPPPLPSIVNPAVPPGLEAVILRALEKDQAKRPQSARELRAALRALVAPASESARMSASAVAARKTGGVGVAATMQAPVTPPQPRPSTTPRAGGSAAGPATAGLDARLETGPTAIAPATPGPLLAAGTGVTPASIASPSPTVRGIELPLTEALAPRRGPGALVGGAVALVALAVLGTWLALREGEPPEGTRTLAAAPTAPRREGTATAPAPAPALAPDPATTPVPAPIALEAVVEPAPAPSPRPAPPAPLGPDKRRGGRAMERAGGSDVAPPAPEPVPSPPPEPASPAPIPPPAPAPQVVRPAPAPAPPPPPGPFEASATIGVASWNGSLPRGTGVAAARRLRAALEECYARVARRTRRNARGTVTVSLTIDENGRAGSIRTSGEPLPGVGACVRTAMGRLAGARPDTGTVDASFRVEFTPRSR
jgi:serine/threonine-protein kinase